MTKRIVLVSAAVLTTILVLIVLWQLRIAVIYVLFSLILAAVLRPLVSRLTGRKAIARAAWILLYLVILCGIGYGLLLAGEAAVREIQQMSQNLSVQNEWILPEWLEGSTFQKTLLARIPTASIIFEALTGDQGQLVIPALLGFTQDIGTVLSGGLVIVFLSVYWSINQFHFERLWLSLLPSGQRKQARDIWRTVEVELGAYVRGQMIFSVPAGLLLGLGYWLIGSPSPVLLGLVGGLTCLVPVFGPILALILPLLLGLLTHLELSLFTVLYTVVVLICLGIWVKPRLFNSRWDNPILSIVLLIALADAIGLIGILIAPPLSVVCQILWNQLVSHRLVSSPATQVSDIKERQVRIEDTIKAMDETPPPLVLSSMERLVRLINEAEPVLLEALEEQPPEKLYDERKMRSAQ